MGRKLHEIVFFLENLVFRITLMLKLQIHVLPNGTTKVMFKVQGYNIRNKKKKNRVVGIAPVKRKKFIFDNNNDEKSDQYEQDMKRAVKVNLHSMHNQYDKKTNCMFTKRFHLPISLMTLNIERTLNVGTMIRTAASFAFKEAFVVGGERLDPRSMVGSQYYFDIHKIPELKNPVEFFNQNHLTPVLVEQGGVDTRDFNFVALARQTVADQKTICLIFGAEGGGIPTSFVSLFPKAPILSISTIGIIRSINVSIAAGIVMNKFQEAFYSLAKHWCT